MTVGVVGAGITGLATTHRLAERGVDVVAFEADARPGGVIRSARVDDRVLEYGPQRVRLTRRLESLVDDLGLRESLLVADEDLPLYVYADGRLREVPRSLRAFARTDLLSWRGKLRVLAEPLTAPARPEERAAEVFERKFGHEAYRNVLEPLFGGIYGSDPATMPAGHALSPLLALEEREGSLLRAAVDRLASGGDVPPPVSFADGLGALPSALYEANRPYVHLDTPVESVREDGGDGYVLESADGTASVDAVVVTVPAAAAASILEDLESATAGPLRRLAYNPLALVHLEADVDVEGFGYQVRRDESLRTLGVSWNDSMFDREGVYTAFLGGMDDPGVLECSDEALGEIASREFATVVDGDPSVPTADPSVLDVRRLPRAFPAYDTSWSALEAVSLPADVILATNYTARMGVSARVREAFEVADRLADGVDDRGTGAEAATAGGRVSPRD